MECLLVLSGDTHFERDIMEILTSSSLTIARSTVMRYCCSSSSISAAGCQSLRLMRFVDPLVPAVIRGRRVFH